MKWHFCSHLTLNNKGISESSLWFSAHTHYSYCFYFVFYLIVCLLFFYIIFGNKHEYIDIILLLKWFFIYK